MIVFLFFIAACAAAQPAPFLFSFADSLGAPAGIAACPDSSIVVTDEARNCVIKYSANGAFVGEAGGTLGLNCPQGLTRRRGFGLFVCDERTGRLVQFDERLSVISSLSLSERAGEGPFNPSSIATGSDGTLVAGDRVNGSVVRIGQDNSVSPFLKAYRDLGGTAITPVALAVVSNTVFIADAAHRTIYAFDRFGTFIRSFGKGLDVPPAGLAAYPDTLLAAADCINHTIVLFSERGERVRVLSLDSAPQGCVPGAICRAFGRWYAADTKNRRICVFGSN